jgi:phage terminase Nu1 subunit (DNA packaging protein)
MLEKWSLTRLSEETSMDRRTIKKLLEKAEPCDFDGEHPMYRLADLIAAIRARVDSAESELERAKTRLTEIQADHAALDYAVAQKNFVPVDIIFQVMSNLLLGVRRQIELSEIPNDVKDKIYDELQNLKASDFVKEAKFEEGEKE